MELKHGNAIDNAPLFMLLIAPLMELKHICRFSVHIPSNPFNRTAYGIETTYTKLESVLNKGF